MAPGVLDIVGRTAELAALRGALAELERGRGGLWLLTGEPGIGKSRLAEELARDAEAAGVECTWGRSWESGGAPADLPWIQVLRSLFRDRGAGALDSLAPGHRLQLAQLLPELRGEGEPAPAVSGHPDRARFELLDAICGALCDRARRRPLLLLLEDLHAADASSLLLLDFLAHQIRGAPLAIVGTYRDTGAEAGGLLQRILEHGRTLPLGRLARLETAGFLAAALGRPPDSALVDAVQRRTEGNPLFVVELARSLVGGRDGLAADAIPPTVRGAIADRLAALPAATREALALASIVGREASLAVLAEAFDRAVADLRADLEPALLAGTIVAVAPGSVRFSHMLVREAVLAGFDDAVRAAHHRRLAATLRRRHPAESAPWSEIALHFLAAGTAARDDAVDAAIRAARRAGEVLAYEDAVDEYRRALAACAADAEIGADGGAGAVQRRRARLLIGLGGALGRAGDADGSRAACREAVGLGRTLGAPALIAEAALELGAALRFAQVDPSLVALLEEAAAALGPAPTPLRARVLARLAAARQPARDPAQPMALAREAVAMARACADPPTLLAVLRDAASTLMDLAPPAERVDLEREQVALARSLGDRVELFRGLIRLCVDCFELGDRAGLEAATAEVGAVADGLHHPYFRWRVVALQAARALWLGDFAAAERDSAEARALGEQACDPNIGAGAVWQRMRLLRLTGRDGELCALAPEVRALFRGTPVAEAIVEVIAAAMLLASGRPDEALRRLGPAAVDTVLGFGDRTSLEALAELGLAAAGAEVDPAVAAPHRDLAARVAARIAGEEALYVSGGVVGMTWDGPMRRLLALTAWAMGRLDEAVGHLERGIDAVRRIDGAPMAAWMSEELARLLVARSGPGDAARAAALAGEAASAAAALGMASVHRRARAIADRAAVEPAAAHPAHGLAAPPAIALLREGDYWTVRADDRSVRLRDSKGLQYLARLVEAPGRELHVLELLGAGDEIDRGDAGELLDARAVAAYRARAAALEEERQQAAAWNDSARRARLEEELEALAGELSRGLGLGGRTRRAGGAAERARINVQRRLRDTLRRIAEHDPALARSIERSIRTGVFCCYQPT